MAQKKQSPSMPPTMSPQQAIPLLKRQIERLQEIRSLHFKDPKIEAWESTTKNILNAVYGQPNGDMHQNTEDFLYARGGVSLHTNMSDGEVQREHEGRQEQRKHLLEAYVEQLQDLAPPVAGGRVATISSILRSSRSAARSFVTATTSRRL